VGGVTKIGFSANEITDVTFNDEKTSPDSISEALRNGGYAPRGKAELLPAGAQKKP